MEYDSGPTEVLIVKKRSQVRNVEHREIFLVLTEKAFRSIIYNCREKVRGRNVFYHTVSFEQLVTARHRETPNIRTQDTLVEPA